MFHQTGQHSLVEPGALDFLWTQEAGGDTRKDADPRPQDNGLPTFVSSGPPRSEGEALLRRIFSRVEVV